MGEEGVTVRKRPSWLGPIGLLLSLGVLMWSECASAAQLTLTWTDASTNEDGFEIEQDPNGGNVRADRDTRGEHLLLHRLERGRGDHVLLPAARIQRNRELAVLERGLLHTTANIHALGAKGWHRERYRDQYACRGSSAGLIARSRIRAARR